MGLNMLFVLGIGLLSIVACADRIAVAMGSMLGRHHRPSRGKHSEWYCFFSPDRFTADLDQKTESGMGKRKENRKQMRYRRNREEQRAVLNA